MSLTTSWKICSPWSQATILLSRLQTSKAYSRTGRHLCFRSCTLYSETLVKIYFKKVREISDNVAILLRDKQINNLDIW